MCVCVCVGIYKKHVTYMKKVKSFYVIQTEVVGISKAFCDSCIFTLTELTQITIKNFISYRTISNCSLHYNAKSVNYVKKIFIS